MSLARRSRLALLLVITACILAGCDRGPSRSPEAQEVVNVGYQTLVDPGKVPQSDARLRMALGEKVRWRLFSSGPAIVAALASGAVQIGHIGSVPLASALSQQLPVEVFMIASQTLGAEALVVRPWIGSPMALRGRLLATPFGSTAHYSLLRALRHWGLRPDEVRLVNLGPGDIAAAWRRGDIDGAYVWSPALSRLKRDGRVLADSADLARWGAPTFNVWVTRRDYARRHPEALRRFVVALQQDYAAYNRAPAPWSRRHAEQISRLTGVPAAEVPAMLAGSVYPEIPAQASAAWLGGGAARQTAATARFLRDQNVIRRTLADYGAGFSRQYLPPDIARAAAGRRPGALRDLPP